jgi:hypothetical protein
VRRVRVPWSMQSGGTAVRTSSADSVDQAHTPPSKLLDLP